MYNNTCAKYKFYDKSMIDISECVTESEKTGSNSLKNVQKLYRLLSNLQESDQQMYQSVWQSLLSLYHSAE